MNAPDFTARALAMNASADLPVLYADLARRTYPDNVTELRSAGCTVHGRGAGIYVSDAIADAALVTMHSRFAFTDAGGRHWRLKPQEDGLIHVDQAGALGDGETNDADAIHLAHNYIEAIGAGGLRFGPGVYGVAYSGMHWAAAHTRVVGAGIDFTTIKNINYDGQASAGLNLGSTEGTRFEDLTFQAAGAFGTLWVDRGVVRNVTFRRVRFTATRQHPVTGEWFASTNGVRWVLDDDAARAEHILFEECRFEGCNRMGVEIQNHVSGDQIARYRDFRFERCHFVDIGEANAEAGYGVQMGISLTGYGEDVRIEDCYFDNLRGVVLENIGCSRLAWIRPRIRHDTMGNALLQCTNTRPMHDCLYEGLRWVTGPDDDIAQSPPPVGANFRIANTHSSVIRDNHLSTTGLPAIQLDNNGAPSSKCTIENNVLHADVSNVIAATHSGGHRIRRNVLRTTASPARPIAFYGDSFDNVVEANVLEAPGDPSMVAVTTTGSASYRVDGVNSARLAEVLSGTRDDVAVTPSHVASLSAPVSLPFSASITADHAAGRVFKVSLTGHTVIQPPFNRKPGERGSLFVTQDATGGWSVGFATGWIIDAGAIAKKAGAISIVDYVIQPDYKILARVRSGVARRPHFVMSGSFAGTYSFDSSKMDGQRITGQAQDLTVTPDVNFPADGQAFQLAIKAAGGARTVTLQGGGARAFADPFAKLTASGSNSLIALANGEYAVLHLIFDIVDQRWIVDRVNRTGTAA